MNRINTTQSRHLLSGINIPLVGEALFLFFMRKEFLGNQSNATESLAQNHGKIN